MSRHAWSLGRARLTITKFGGSGRIERMITGSPVIGWQRSPSKRRDIQQVELAHAVAHRTSWFSPSGGFQVDNVPALVVGVLWKCRGTRGDVPITFAARTKHRWSEDRFTGEGEPEAK